MIDNHATFARFEQEVNVAGNPLAVGTRGRSQISIFNVIGVMCGSLFETDEGITIVKVDIRMDTPPFAENSFSFSQKRAESSFRCPSGGTRSGAETLRTFDQRKL